MEIKFKVQSKDFKTVNRPSSPTTFAKASVLKRLQSPGQVALTSRRDKMAGQVRLHCFMPGQVKSAKVMKKVEKFLDLLELPL